MGKKSRKTPNHAPPSATLQFLRTAYKDVPFLKNTVDTVSGCLKQAEEENAPIENFFKHHVHSISVCDGQGAFSIVSLFVFGPRISPPRSKDRGIITICIMRGHDNIRETSVEPTEGFDLKEWRLQIGVDPETDRTLDEWYQVYLDLERDTTGRPLRRASYQECAKLVSDCLVRMEKSKKTLNGKMGRTVARIYSMKSTNPLHQKLLAIPAPAPAPNAETLWLTLNRPEYHSFSFSVEFTELTKERHNRIRDGPDDMPSLVASFLDYVVEDRYRRSRILSMLKHMALWHMLGNEEDVASWLLWERRSMIVNDIDDPATIDAMKNNIIVQFMTHFGVDFRSRAAGALYEKDHPGRLSNGLYGQAVMNFIFWRYSLQCDGCLPPSVMLTATIAKDTEPSNSVRSDRGSEPVKSICDTIKKLKINNSACALCGATRSTSGGLLATCSRCDSVCYCCREHQVMHWKKFGHKQECLRRDCDS